MLPEKKNFYSGRQENLNELLVTVPSVGPSGSLFEWKMRSVNSYGGKGKWSDTRKFAVISNISLSAPSNNESFDLTGSTVRIFFNWHDPVLNEIIY